MSNSIEKRDSLSHPDEELAGGAVLRSDSAIEAEGGNLLLQVDNAAASGLKTAADGKVRIISIILCVRVLNSRAPQTILVPQPSSDPNDPLNWSTFKKHSILLIVALAAFGGDFQSGAGIPVGITLCIEIVVPPFS